MTQLSQYVRIYKFEGQTLIYNTINGEIIILPGEYVIDNKLSEQLGYTTKEYMYNHLFLDRDLPWKKFEDCFESNNRLLISLETFLACNLSCPYCYQINNNHLKAKISKTNLDLLFDYISSVFQKVQFDILSLKILGGEPSLDWAPADYLLNKIIPFCDKNKVRLDLRIDTNCTDISSFISISGYDTILFTVPLCHKKYHNKYRHYKNGKDTYDDILENIAALEKMPRCRMILRHNTDASNILLFDDYLADISQKGFSSTTIMPQYTLNPNYGEFKNELSYQDYINWLSSDCIDSMIRYGFKIPIYPRLLLDGKCQQWSNYSLKLFSDGKVGACAAHFFDSTNPYLSEIMKKGIDSIKTYWNYTKSSLLFNDSNCRNCKSLFGCSGHYQLPCIKELNLKKCQPEESLYLNWPLYFHTLFKQIKNGNRASFPGLNILSILS